MNPTFRIRPFDTFISRGAGRPAWRISGSVEGTTFVVTMHHQRVELDTREVGNDARGSFAVIAPCSRSLPDGFLMDVGPEDEDLDALRIYVHRNQEAIAAAAAIVHAAGGDVAGGNLVVPPEQQADLYFDLDGCLESTPEAPVEAAERGELN